MKLQSLPAIVRLAILLLLSCEAPSAYAVDTPFAWPNSYMVTLLESHKGHTIPAFFNVFSRDHLKMRNQYLRDGGFQVEIFRLDEHKKIVILANGETNQATLPSDWPVSNIFPRDRPWKPQGIDQINGLPALRYEISRSPMTDKIKPVDTVTVWLTSDKKTPLRMEDGDTTIDFLNYAVGPQNPALFEVASSISKK